MSQQQVPRLKSRRLLESEWRELDRHCEMVDFETALAQVKLSRCYRIMRMREYGVKWKEIQRIFGRNLETLRQFQSRAIHHRKNALSWPLERALEDRSYLLVLGGKPPKTAT